MKNKVTAIIQARLESTRLPGKVLYPISKKPVLCHLIERVQRSKTIDNILLVTTNREIDKTLGEYAKQYNCDVYYGKDKYVLNNIMSACNEYHVDIIVDITADCPLIDHRQIDKLVKIYKNSNIYSYVANVINRSWPRGFDLQVYNPFTLGEWKRRIKEVSNLNHSGWNIMIREDKSKMFDFYSHMNYSEWRLCIDEKEDYILIKAIFEHFKNNKFSYSDIVKFLLKRPELLDINKHIIQKKAGLG